jgi:hypothetical protein
MKGLLIILLGAVFLQTVLAAYCNGKPGKYLINDEPIWSGKSTPIKKHQYGELHRIGQGSNEMNLLHVYGSMYQMGLAQGALLKGQLNSFI